MLYPAGIVGWLFKETQSAHLRVLHGAAHGSVAGHDHDNEHHQRVHDAGLGLNIGDNLVQSPKDFFLVGQVLIGNFQHNAL